MARKTKQVDTQAIVPAQQAGALAPMEPWEIELAEKAKAAVANETVGLQRIEHKNNQLIIDGKPVQGNKLRLIILAYNFAKSYFDKAYTPGQADTPACYAFARPEAGDKGMAPMPQSREKQSEQCDGCPHNRFGTALQGSGKRCSDTRRVLCVIESNDPDSIKHAEVRQLSVPAGSLKNWANYLHAITDLSATGSPSAVVTELSTEAGEAAYRLTFKPVAKLSREQAMAVIAKGKSEEAKLYQPWPEIAKEAAAAPRSAKAKAKIR